ncbi:MAG TPA: DUF5719 family protein [Streptosporangiaceae bacterium]|nr:DUF5719 family protein [Streptosporangiaceae bacterium]
MTARKARRPAAGRQLANRFMLAFLVVLALAGLYGLAGFGRGVRVTADVKPASTAGRLQVSSALVACPSPGLRPPIGGDIAETSAPASTGNGQVALTRLHLVTAARPVTTVSTQPRSGQLTVKSIHQALVVKKAKSAMPSMAGGAVPTSLANGGLIVAATGSDAQGFDVEQLSPGGQPSARCEAPGSDFWFIGPETTKLNTLLYLVNADDAPADAHVGVQTDSGPRLGAPDSGIVVPPHSMVVQNVDKLVRSAKAAALHVTTSTGRVVAAVRETSKSGKAGIWLPPAPAPATTQVLTGLPDTTGTRELFITVPGGASARVKVTAVTPRGTYQPTGGSGISLLGRLTTGIALPSLSGFAGSVKISSNVPVTAVLEVSGGPAGAPGAFVSGSGPVTEQGVVTGPAGKAGTTEIVLSAPGKAATVRIAQAAPGTPVTGQSGQLVTIKARSATKVKLKLPKKEGAATLMAVVVTPQPGSGPVYAARVAISGGNVMTVLAVGSSPTRIDLPAVRESLARVLGSLRPAAPGRGRSSPGPHSSPG